MTLTPSLIMLRAALWLDEQYPKEAHSHVDSSDTYIAWSINVHYPTGLEGFVEDLAQAQAVS
jgi:hypothetical protein